MSLIGALVGPGLLAAGSGWVIYRLWGPFGLPPTGGPLDAPFPGAWRWFFAISVPAVFVAFTAVHARLLRWSARGGTSPALAQAAWRWDRWSYALLPLFLLLMLFWRGLGWRVPFAAFFVAVLFVKTLGLVLALYRGVVRGAGEEDTRPDPPGLGRWLVLAALLCYALLTPYVITALSTVADENIYLLNTHSLYVDGDVDTRNNIAQRDWTRFYWGRPAPSAWTAQFIGFPVLLLPGYALGNALLPHYPQGGRLGATLTISLLAALLGLHVYRLCRELGAPRPTAFWTWMVVVFSPPVLTHSSHLFPEIPPALAAVVGVRAVLRIPERAVAGLAGAVGAAVLMVAVKDRFTPIALGLLLWALVRLATRHALAGLALLLGLVAGGLYVIALNPLPRLFPNLANLPPLRDLLVSWNWLMPRAVLGLFADQEYGLLYYAPHWTLAVLGVAPLWQRRREAALGLLGVVGLYLFVLMKYQWPQWDGGWSPPPRFMVVTAPLLAPFVAEAFDRCRGPLLAAVNSLWLVWTGALAVLLSLVPFWRFNNLDGRSTLLQLAGAALGLDLARFLPSLRAPTVWTWIVLALGGAGLLAAACHYARRRTSGDPGWGVRAVWLRPVPTAALIVALAGLWLGGAALVPTWSLEAEAMGHSAGVQFGSHQTQPGLWVMTRDGDIWERIVTWPGLTEIAVVAAGQTTTGVAPRMTLLLDGRSLAEWTLRAGNGQWIQDTYVVQAPTGFGRPLLTLRFADVLDQRAAGRVQHAYVDRIRLRRVEARQR